MDIGRDLDPDAQRPAPFVQVGQRHPAGHGRVVIGREQDGPLRAVRAGGGAGDQLGDGQGLGFRDGGFAGAFEDKVPGVGVSQGTGAVEGAAESAEQGVVAELDVADVAGGGADLRRLALVLAVVPRSQCSSRRSRNAAALPGGSGGAVTAKVTTACKMSA